jgi:large subunit ribosomal protein L4
MKVDVVNSDNKKVGSLELNDDVFGGRVNSAVIWESVVHANAAERRGTHASKNRALVSGSGRKPWKQKGTGRARVGDIRNPLWRHGGTVFGPQPRSYDYALPRKVKRGAIVAALAAKMQDGSVVVVDQLAATEIKTKAAVCGAWAPRARRCSSTCSRTRSSASRCATSPACSSWRARAWARAMW